MVNLSQNNEFDEVDILIISPSFTPPRRKRDIVRLKTVNVTSMSQSFPFVIHSQAASTHYCSL